MRAPERKSKRTRSDRGKRFICLASRFDYDLMEAFKREAANRGLSSSGLLGELIEAIVDDNLFDAVLGEKGL